jgi:hypothetical protein
MLVSLPDFSQPGSDGTLPDGFKPWQWLVSYTARPEIFSPLPYRQEYRIMASVARRTHGEAFTGYAALYERALAIANGRASNIRCSGPDFILHQRVLNHGWFNHDRINLTRAFVCLGISCWKQEDIKPCGEATPTVEELAAPRITPQSVAPDTVHEIYNDTDMRDAVSPTDIFLVSYGEYVKAGNGIDYAPFIQRAEDLANFHLPFLTQGEPSQPDRNALKIIRREWFCATNPDIAVVHVYMPLSAFTPPAGSASHQLPLIRTTSVPVTWSPR